MADKWTKKAALEMLKRNRVAVAGLQIDPKGGIKVQGAIDYLSRHGYRRA